MRKLAALILILAAAISLLTGCSEPKKTVHCDKCGKEFEISADSNMDDSWDLYCKECEKELGLETIVE